MKINMTTFVTAIFNLKNSKPNDYRKSLENRLKYFEELISYNINISIICCPYYEPYIRKLIEKYHNVKLIDVMNLSDTVVYKICDEYEKNNEPLYLPNVRDNDKDDREYLILMNSKIEFVKKAIDVNIWNSKYFCWIDFSIKYMIHDENIFKININKLKYYEMPLSESTNIIIPGIETKKEIIYWHPWWRYSGTIFYGYKDDLSHFYEMNCKYFKEFIETKSLLTWEITMWAWYEWIGIINPIWVHGRHDDSIISFVNNE
jgi:hypothetical protein